jgi:predicted nuclease of predicted toxin-antitoxin system
LADVRYQFDEHMDSAVARALRREGIDLITTAEAGLLGAADVVQLAHAHSTGRVMVTQDKDFLRLSRQGVEHGGIVYFAHGTRTIREGIDGLT